MLQFIQIVALDCVLKLRCALSAADAEILRRLKIQRHAWNGSELRTQTTDDLVG